MHLRAGLIRTSPLWGEMLDREGYPWRFVRSPDQVDVDEYSVIIAGKISGTPWEEVLKAYIRAGGAAVVDEKVLAGWIEGRPRWRRYHYLLPVEDSWLRGLRPVDITGRGLAARDGGQLRTDRGGNVLPVRLFGEGAVSSFPLDMAQCISDGGSSRKFFVSPVEPYPSERVSRVPKGELRLMVRGVLKALHHIRGLHYTHLWFFPEDASNIFGLRVDTDYSSRDEVRRLYAVIAEKEVPASWFLHVKAHVGWIREFAGMKGQEIGVHCYSHREYGSYGLRRSDIEKARDLLLAAGLEPWGFSAPYGVWKEDLPIDLEGLGFRYSSEFGYDYDNLPSYPWVRGGFSKVLHLPVHPISIGNLALIGYNDREMADYYAAVVDRKLSVSEPIFIYLHPGDDHLGVLRNLLERIDEESIRTVSFAEYVDWWRHRGRVLREIDVSLEGEKICFRTGGEDRSDRLRACITKPGGSRSLCGLAERTDLKDLSWNPPPSPPGETVEIRTLLGGRRRRLLEDIRTYFWRRRG